MCWWDVKPYSINHYRVAAPERQGSQVISRSLRSWGRSSGANVSAVKEPGHFEVGKFFQARSPDALFSWKKVEDLVFSRRPQNTGRQRRWLFHCQDKTNKAVRYSSIFIFCLHCYRSKAIAGRSQGGGSSSQIGSSCQVISQGCRFFSQVKRALV